MFCICVLVLVIQRQAVARGHTTPVQRHAWLRPLDLEVFGRRRRSRPCRHLGRSGNSFGRWERERVRVNAGFGELGRLNSRKGPAPKMLPTADQARGVQRFNVAGDLIAGTMQSSSSRLRRYGESVRQRGKLWGSTMEYRVSGWMDSWCKRWTTDGKGTLLFLRQQKTISRVDLRQELGTMGTRWSSCFAGKLEYGT